MCLTGETGGTVRGGEGFTVSVKVAQYYWHYLAIACPASIYNVKVNLIAELGELLEGRAHCTVCVQLAKLAELSEGGRVSP